MSQYMYAGIPTESSLKHLKELKERIRVKYSAFGFTDVSSSLGPHLILLPPIEIYKRWIDLLIRKELGIKLFLLRPVKLYIYNGLVCIGFSDYEMSYIEEARKAWWNRRKLPLNHKENLQIPDPKIQLHVTLLGLNKRSARYFNFDNFDLEIFPELELSPYYFCKRKEGGIWSRC
jgi:hypothetical protein